MSDFILNLLITIFGKIPVGVLIGFGIGWWARKYVLKRNPALIAELDAEANAQIDKAKAKLDVKAK